MKKRIILLQLFFATGILSQWVFDGYLPYDSLHSPVVLKVCVIDSSVSWAMGVVYINQNMYTPYFAKRTVTGWHHITYSGLDSGVNAYSIAAIDSMNVWLGTFHPDNIYYSSNGGINWSLQYHIADTGHVYGITFCRQNPLIGYAFASLAFNTFWNGVKILKTTNGGQNWTKWDFAYYGYMPAGNSMAVVDSNYVWFGVDNVLSGLSKIISTTNGGLNWSVIDINPGYDGPYTVQFSDDKQTGLFVGQTSPTSWFYRTTNAGINWNIVYTTSYYYSETMRWIPGTSNIYGNSEFVIVRSTNSGSNWAVMPGGTITNLESMDAVRINSGTIYALAVTNDRNVYKLLDSARVIGIENLGTEVPKEFRVYQNYPNPFNPSTTIKFDLPKDSRVSIKIYDILGREIAVLADNEFKNAGSYKVDWNSASFSSGVYFYRIEAGGFVVTKSMILVK